ncbi:uncharacterized protein LOC126802276 [Argentina anserina]|uniref:uncharacterized protein LOC126802276 n=1 Tax=Argentina anserina TaxID=57926 RepID=UPI0021762F1E|nr:uncharacterized protein LOC126802276 [Potentilla anserina]
MATQMEPSRYSINILQMFKMAGRGQSCVQSKRYLLPSGPIALPLIILALAKGHRINTSFPLSTTGPAILQLVLISALTFTNGGDSDIQYVFFKASTISGILHASMYLDAVILPYYTGLDALVKSTFSGECPSCVCRNEDLVVGGRLVSYTGWSFTSFLVVGTLCWRVVCRLYGRKLGKFTLVRPLLESSSWILITIDCVYLSTISPPEKLMLPVAAFGGILVLICLCVTRELCTSITHLHFVYKYRTADICNRGKVEMTN